MLLLAGRPIFRIGVDAGSPSMLFLGSLLLGLLGVKG